MADVILAISDADTAEWAEHRVRMVGLSVERVSTALACATAAQAARPLALVWALPWADAMAAPFAALWRTGGTALVLLVADAAEASAARAAGAAEVLVLPVPGPTLTRALGRVPGLVEASARAPVGMGELDLATAVELGLDFLRLSLVRLEAMHASLAALSGADAAAALEAVEREGHRFKGSGSAYGYPEVTRLGAELERWCQGLAAPVAPALQAEMAIKVAALAQVLRMAAQDAGL